MTFAADIDKFVSATKAKVDDVVRAAVVLAAQGVVMKSPVGNPDLWKVPRADYVGGRFRANWQLGIGNLNEETTGDIDASGNGTIAKFVSGMSGQKAGGVFWVSNSLPYALRLEYGWSTQAPAGVVRVTFAELPDQIEAYARSLP